MVENAWAPSALCVLFAPPSQPPPPTPSALSPPSVPRPLIQKFSLKSNLIFPFYIQIEIKNTIVWLMFTVVETKRGKPCLIFNNYCYLRNRIRNRNIYWRCEKCGECPGRLTQKAGKEPVLTAAHNHDPDENKKKKKMFMTNLKRRIREDPIPVRKLFRGELINRLNYK